MSASTILRRPVFWACAILGLLASCIDDFAEGAVSPGFSGGEREVIIKLRVPQQTLPSAPGGGSTTRSIESMKPEINDLYILAFQSTGKLLNNVAEEPFLYYTKAEITDNKWTAKLRATNYPQTFVVIANMEKAGVMVSSPDENKDENTDTTTPAYDLEDQLKKALAGAVGTNKTEVLKKLYLEVEGKIDPKTDLPLTGQSESTLISDKGTTAQTISVNLYRMVAKINVTTANEGGGNLKGFTMQEVHVYNRQRKGLVASRQLKQQLPPASSSESPQASMPTEPTLPDTDNDGYYDMPSQDALVYTTTESNNSYAIIDFIYLFEAGQPDEYPLPPDSVKADLGAYRPCIVVKGDLNADSGVGTGEYYWRIDLTDQDGKPLNIVRNYVYHIIIKEIKGVGSPTPEEALKSSRTNINATVLAWNENNLGGVSFGENNFLGLGKIAYTYGIAGSLGFVEQTVAATPELEWTATITDKQGNTPDWISFYNISAGENESPVVHTIQGRGQGIDKPATLLFIVQPHEEGGDDRFAYMRFKAGNLDSLTCIVTQTSDRILALNTGINPTIEFSDNGRMIGNQGIDIQFGPNDTKLSWYASPGTLKEINGDKLGELLGQANANLINFGGRLSDARKLVAGPMSDDVGEGVVPEGSLYLMVTDLKDNTNTLSAVIPMRQLKYWLKFRTNTVLVPDDGSRVYIDVESNFNWKCTGYCYPSTAEDYGLNDESEGAEKRPWADEATVLQYEKLVNAFNGEQSGESYDSSKDTDNVPANKTFYIDPVRFNSNDNDALLRTARMDFFFTDMNGEIAVSDSLQIWRALYMPSGNVYRVKKTETPMTHNEYGGMGELEEYRIKNLLDYDKEDIQTHQWYTLSPRQARMISRMRPYETFWFSGSLFGGYQLADLSDGGFKPVLYGATVTNDSVFTAYEMLMAMKSKTTSINYVILSGTDETPMKLGYTIYTYDAQPPKGGVKGSKFGSYAVLQSSSSEDGSIWMGHLKLKNSIEGIGEWTVMNFSSGTVYPSVGQADWKLYGLPELFDSDGKIIGGDPPEEVPNSPLIFQFHENAYTGNLKFHGYYVKPITELKSDPVNPNTSAGEISDIVD